MAKKQPDRKIVDRNRKSRGRGTAFEYRVQDWFRRHGIRADRTPMSGASEKAGLSDILANDEVFLLARNRKRMSLITFFDEAKEKGLKESKRVGKRRIPGVVITEPGRGGFFFMFHSEDMMEIAEVLINVRAGNGSTYSRARFISKLRELADSIEREGEEDE